MDSLFLYVPEYINANFHFQKKTVNTTKKVFFSIWLDFHRYVKFKTDNINAVLIFWGKLQQFFETSEK